MCLMRWIPSRNISALISDSFLKAIFLMGQKQTPQIRMIMLDVVNLRDMNRYYVDYLKEDNF